MNGNDFLDKLGELDLSLVANANRPPEPKQRWRFNWGAVVAVAMLLAVLCLPMGLSYLIEHDLIPAASGDGQGATSHQAPGTEDSDELSALKSVKEEVEAKRDAAAAAEQSWTQAWGEDWTIPSNVQSLPEGVTWSISGIGKKGDSTPQYRWNHYTLTKEYVKETYGDRVPVEEYFRYTSGESTHGMLAEECDTDPSEAWYAIREDSDDPYGTVSGYAGELAMPTLADTEMRDASFICRPDDFFSIRNHSKDTTFQWLNIHWLAKDPVVFGEFPSTVTEYDYRHRKLISVNLAHTNMVGDERMGMLYAGLGGETQVIFKDAQVSAYGSLNGDKAFTGWMGESTWFRLYCTATVEIEDVQIVLDWLLARPEILEDPYNTNPSVWRDYIVDVAQSVFVEELDQVISEDILPYFPVSEYDGPVPSIASNVARRYTSENGKEFYVTLSPHPDIEAQHLLDWTFYEKYNHDRPPQAYPDVADLFAITRENLEEEWERQTESNFQLHGEDRRYRLKLFWNDHYITMTFDRYATVDDLWAIVEIMRNQALPSVVELN